MGTLLAMRICTWVAAALLTAGCQQGAFESPGSDVQVVLSSEASSVRIVRSVTAPALEVQIPARNARALLSRVGENGGVETWIAEDNISISLHDGVLVASRGLGFDLMGAGAAETHAALAHTDETVYRRQMRYLTGDNRSTYVTAGCSMKLVGREQFGNQSLQRFEERCAARSESFTNVFWRDRRGEIVRSRQWLSPEVGYVSFHLLP